MPSARKFVSSPRNFMSMINLVIYALITVGYSFGFYLLFPKAGRQAWEGLIPGYNFFILTKIIKKPWWWCLLLVFPGVNVLMLMVFNSITATVFGKIELKDQALAVLLPFIMFPIWGKSEIKFLGPIDRSKVKKSTLREWGDAIVFAVIAASIIRTYFLEAFTIPTASMEKTLLIGDYLFVSKMAYGPKVPLTPLSFPFAHHTLPGTEIPSYLEWMKLPYNRLPGFGEVERNDIVVFNYPEGDTVTVELQSNMSYNQLLRNYELIFGAGNARKFLWDGIPTNLYNTPNVNNLMGMLQQLGQSQARANKILKEGFDITVRPVDKREHYIKRCVAIPGDEIFIENSKLHINGETAYIPPGFQFNYIVQASNSLNKNIVKDKLDVNYQDYRGGQNADGYIYSFPMTLEALETLERFGSVQSARIDMSMKGARTDRSIFPNQPTTDWTVDNWGKITVPAQGATVPLTIETLPFYSRVISVYEGHNLKIDRSNILIDGEVAAEYTFEMDYYFMMGDNRHNSADSRYWGFVPEDHIVGKPAIVWLSLDPERTLFDGKIRWERMFSIPE